MRPPFFVDLFSFARPVKITNNLSETVTGVPGIKYEVSSEELHVLYYAGLQIDFIHAMNLLGKNCFLSVFDLTGSIVYKADSKINSEYSTKDINCDKLAKGLYIVTPQTEKAKQIQRFVKE